MRSPRKMKMEPFSLLKYPFIPGIMSTEIAIGIWKSPFNRGQNEGVGFASQTLLVYESKK